MKNKELAMNSFIFYKKELNLRNIMHETLKNNHNR